MKTPMKGWKGLAALLAAIVSLLMSQQSARATWSYDPPVGISLASDCRGLPFPELVADRAGGAFVTWMTYEGDMEGPFYVQHVLGSGNVDPLWPPNGVVSYPGVQQRYPILAVDGSGGVFAVVEDGQTGRAHPFAFHVLVSGIADPSWPSNGLPLCLVNYRQWSPHIVSDEHGGGIVIWSDFRGPLRDDIYATHLSADGTVAPFNGYPIANTADNEHPQDFIIDPGRGAFVSWVREPPYSVESDIYLQHLLPDATKDPDWPASGLALCTLPGQQGFPQIAPDRRGGAFVMWGDARNYQNWQIYLHHVLPGGSLDPDWPVDGLRMNPTVTDQHQVDVIWDGLDGIVVVYQEVLSPEFDEVRVQHVFGNGVVDPSWPPDGVPVGLMRHVVWLPKPCGVVPDGTGGVVIVWRSPAPDIYAQHVLSTGMIDPAWPAEGRPVSLKDGDEGDFMGVVTDGYGGAIAAWQDGSSWDQPFGVAIAKVPLSMVLDAPATSPAKDAMLLRVVPNPSHGETSVRWTQARRGPATLVVHDVNGRRIRSLLAGGEFEAGEHTARWDLLDEAGRAVAAGLYFVTLATPEGRTVKRFSVAR